MLNTLLVVEGNMFAAIKIRWRRQHINGNEQEWKMMSRNLDY